MICFWFAFIAFRNFPTWVGKNSGCDCKRKVYKYSFYWSECLYLKNLSNFSKSFVLRTSRGYPEAAPSTSHRQRFGHRCWQHPKCRSRPTAKTQERHPTNLQQVWWNHHRALPRWKWPHQGVSKQRLKVGSFKSEQSSNTHQNSGFLRII